MTDKTSKDFENFIDLTAVFAVYAKAPWHAPLTGLWERPVIGSTSLGVTVKAYNIDMMEDTKATDGMAPYAATLITGRNLQYPKLYVTETREEIVRKMSQ